MNHMLSAFGSRGVLFAQRAAVQLLTHFSNSFNKNDEYQKYFVITIGFDLLHAGLIPSACNEAKCLHYNRVAVSMSLNELLAGLIALLNLSRLYPLHSIFILLSSAVWADHEDVLLSLIEIVYFSILAESSKLSLTEIKKGSKIEKF